MTTYPDAITTLTDAALPRRERRTRDRQYPMRGPLLCILPGTPDSVSTARQLARQLLGDDDSVTETVMLLLSELVTNAIVHSRSGEPGGTVTVAVSPGRTDVLVQVRDDGGTSKPRLAAVPGDGAECGYGLRLVDALADSWATVSCSEGRVTWCRVSGAASTRGARSADGWRQP